MIATVGPTAVYLLCLATSAACAALLARSWRRTRTPLLLWTAIGFVLLAINNLCLVVDLLVFTRQDLSLVRQATALAAVAVMAFGFIRERSR